MRTSEALPKKGAAKRSAESVTGGTFCRDLSAAQAPDWGLLWAEIPRFAARNLRTAQNAVMPSSTGQFYRLNSTRKQGSGKLTAPA